MPRRDGTGPQGAGAGTGRGMGPCCESGGSGFGRGRGFGRTMCGRGMRRFQAMTKSDKETLLKDEIGDLKQELEMAEKELEELGK